MSKNKTTATPSLKNVASKLKAGEVTKLANATGYSASHVSNVLAGRRTNATIANAATKMTSRRK